MLFKISFSIVLTELWSVVLIVSGVLVVVEAKNCEMYCPSLITPVCGKHYIGGKQVFTNECQMHKYNCEKSTRFLRIPMSLCKNELREYQQNTMQISFLSNKKCKWSCVLEYSPICACNQKVTKSFINDCLLKLYNCEFGTNFQRIHNGFCFHNLLEHL